MFSLNRTMWEMCICHRYGYFSSFEAGNCVRNSSFKRMTHTIWHLSNTRVNGAPQQHKGSRRRERVVLSNGLRLVKLGERVFTHLVEDEVEVHVTQHYKSSFKV